MCMPRAAGQPWLQVGKMSAGLERESGIKLCASLEGARAADWAALKSLPTEPEFLVRTDPYFGKIPN